MNILEQALGIFGYNKTKEVPSAVQSPVKKVVTKPAARVSESEYRTDTELTGGLEGFTTPDYDLSVVRKLRSLTSSNEDVGAVYNDLIQLTNTGHKIVFDQSIDTKLQDEMRKHLLNKSAKWGSGVAGISGLINKWIGQIWVTGALSNEWIPSNDLTGIENNVLVNPENIRFKYNNSTTRYDPYQIILNKLFKRGGNVVKLNTNTYFYVGILGNTDSPYGIPPFLTALKALSTQGTMKKNIDHILTQLGLLGYLEVKLDKPAQEPHESLPAYKIRLENLLTDSKKNMIGGFSEGVVVGYADDHEFTFHATSKSLAGVSELFNQNEVQVANGLKSAPSFIGQKSNGTETNMSIVFTKMLSQLRNVQDILSANLVKGYLLELQLAGFNIKTSDIKVLFNTSTITDDLKLWQGKEIKQRVLKALVIDGIISQDTYAEEQGYSKPYKDKPLVPYDQQVGKTKDAEQKGKDADVKSKSARKGRDKDKKQPKRKDAETKPK